MDLSTPLVKHRKREKAAIRLNIPFASAVMQSVSDHQMAKGKARCGGIAFVFVSQPVESQADMVGRAKRFKAGLVPSDSNLRAG